MKTMVSVLMLSRALGFVPAPAQSLIPRWRQATAEENGQPALASSDRVEAPAPQLVAQNRATRSGMLIDDLAQHSVRVKEERRG